METRVSNNAKLIGIVLVVLGAFSLLQNFGMLGFASALVWAAIFGLGGIAFLYVFLRDKTHWWAVIPASTLLGIALTIVADMAPWIPGGLVGALFLGSLSLGFFAVYGMDHTRWWALIPGGTMLSVAATAFMSEFLPGEAVGGVLFLGLAATFALLALIQPAPNLRWAFIPAGVLGVMGLLLMLSAVQLAGVIWPLALIVLGLALLLRNRNREIYR